MFETELSVFMADNLVWVLLAIAALAVIAVRSGKRAYRKRNENNMPPDAR